MRNLIVEIAGKEGTRIERMALNDTGLSIGRGWDNDIIVQDRFVDPDHLGISLNQEGQILVTDFNSTNGSRLAGKHLNGIPNAYCLGEVLTIGDTRIKVFDAQTSVGATALRSKWFLLAERLSSVKALMMLTVLALLAQATQTIISSNEPLKIESVAVATFAVLMALLVWSLSLGFVAKLLRGESNIKPLWLLGCLAVILLNIADLMLLLVRFNLQQVSLGDSLSLAVFGAFSIWLLAGVFSYTTHFLNRTKWLFSLFLVVSLYAIAKSDDYLKEPHQKWRSSTKIEQATLPPVFLLRKGVSLDDYLKETESLFDVKVGAN